MKHYLFCIFLLVGTTALAQSKKELQAQLKTATENNKTLQGQVDALKLENDQLKKPKQVNLTNAHLKASYGLGVLMASNIRKQGGDSLDLDAMNAGISDVFTKTPTKMDEKECTMTVQQYMQQVMERKSFKIKEESKAFLEANKLKPGTKTTASGLQYEVIKKGTGKSPKATSNVTVHYTGRLVDGTIFDSSEGGDPATFACNQVIPGWTEVLQLMHEGDKWQVVIPSDLAYGDRGAGAEIPPFAVLVFDIELVKVN